MGSGPEGEAKFGHLVLAKEAEFNVYFFAFLGKAFSLQQRKPQVCQLRTTHAGTRYNARHD